MSCLRNVVEESIIPDALMEPHTVNSEKSNSRYQAAFFASGTKGKLKVERRTPKGGGPSKRRSHIPPSILQIVSVFWTKSRAATAWSILLHIAILCVLALIVLADRPVRNVLTINAEFTTEADDPGMLDLRSTDIELSLANESTIPLPTTADLTAGGLPGITELEISLPSFTDPAPPETDIRDAEKKIRTGTKRGKGASVVEGSGEFRGSGKASFFGSEVKAQSIAFVIDASASMSGSRFQRARQELAQALSALDRNQRFFVVFYTDQTYPQFYPNNVVSLITADSRNISKVLHWMERAQTQGGTEPQMALAMSLGLKPDVMFFLSDGEIPFNTRDIVQQANRGTAIHTIAFGSNAGGVILQQIASDTGGTHRFIGDGT